MLLPVLLSIGAVNALVPILIIIILIGAAAGSTRGFSFFNIFGISTLLGGLGAIGGGSRGNMAKSGFPLRLLLDPGKPGVQGVTRVKKRRTPGSGDTHTLLGRMKEVFGPSGRRVQQLRVREGERQLMLRKDRKVNAPGIGGGTVKMAVQGSGRSDAIKTLTGAAWVGNQIGAFRPKAIEVNETRIDVERREILGGKRRIAQGGLGELRGRLNRLKNEKRLIQSEGKKQAKLLTPDENKNGILFARLGVAAQEVTRRQAIAEETAKREAERGRRLNEVERTSMEKEVDGELSSGTRRVYLGKVINHVDSEFDTLASEYAWLNAGQLGFSRRLERLDEESRKIEQANEDFLAGRITERRHRRLFAESYNRLYGAPDKSYFHNAFNPNYGFKLSNTTERFKEKTVASGTAAAYAFGSLPGATIATAESGISKIAKGYVPHYTRNSENAIAPLRAIYRISGSIYGDLESEERSNMLPRMSEHQYYHGKAASGYERSMIEKDDGHARVSTPLKRKGDHGH